MLLAGLRVLVLLGVSALPLGAQATLYIFQASPLTGSSSTGNGFANLAFNDQTNSFNLFLAGVGLSSQITSAQFVSSNPSLTLPVLTTPASTQQTDGYAFQSFYLNMAGSPQFLQALQSGTVTLSLGTTNFPTGEIGGNVTQLSPIPEPATWALAAVGLVIVAGSALRRRHALNSR